MAAKFTGRSRSWIWTELRPQSVTWGCDLPAKWINSRLAQTRQSEREIAVFISDCWLDQTSKDNKLRRSLSPAPIRSLMASVAAMEAIRLTTEFSTPAVSQVLRSPRGASGKTQARQAVSPGTIFIVAP